MATSDLPPIVHPFEEPPEDGEVVEIAPGVLWLRMPLPMVGLNHINLWLFDEGDSWTIVDTGVNDPETVKVWERVFKEELGGKPVSRLVCTHFHPDHMGVAGWLVKRWNDIPLWTGRGEWMQAQALTSVRGEAWRDNSEKFYKLTDADNVVAQGFINIGNPYAKQVTPIPPAFHRLEQGDTFTMGGRDWEIITGKGHSPEHVCLFCRNDNILISGDIVLPNISPLLGVWANEPNQDSLGEYLSCLPQFTHLPEDTLVLPSHKLPFTGLHRRIAELEHHHDERLETTLGACQEPATAWDVTGVLFDRELPPFHKILALSESIAHLNYLWKKGEITRTVIDGVWRYEKA